MKAVIDKLKWNKDLQHLQWGLLRQIRNYELETFRLHFSTHSNRVLENFLSARANGGVR